MTVPTWGLEASGGEGEAPPRMLVTVSHSPSRLQAVTPLTRSACPAPAPACPCPAVCNADVIGSRGCDAPAGEGNSHSLGAAVVGAAGSQGPFTPVVGTPEGLNIKVKGVRRKLKQTLCTTHPSIRSAQGEPLLRYAVGKIILSQI